MGETARSQMRLFNDQTGQLVAGDSFRLAATHSLGRYSPSSQAAYPFSTQNSVPRFTAADIAALNRSNNFAPTINKRLASRFEPATMQPGSGLQPGVKPQLHLKRSDFAQQDINWINYKYQIFETRALAGQEVSKVGAGVPYRYRLSQSFARSTLAPNLPLSKIKLGELAPGQNVDEFVSRQFGGRQVTANQNWAPAAANQLMGSLEYHATKHLPAGTPIWGFEINWF